MSNTGPGGDDLSISELSLSDRPPFTLLARPEPSLNQASEESGYSPEQDDIDAADLLDDVHQDDPDPEQAKRLANTLREEKLQSDAFILKKLNASFALFNEALAKTGSANECLAVRLEQTDALLSKYINILSRSEQTARLILDEKWLGADHDEEVLQRERHEAEQQARRETEERLRAAQQAQEQRQREAREKIEREERERLERERKENAITRGGVRGVRGTRASMRGSRGSTGRISAGAASSSSSAGQAPPGSRKSASGRPSGLPTRAVRAN